MLFITYTADLTAQTEQHDFSPQLYTDDTQVYGSIRPSAMRDLSNVCQCAQMMCTTGCDDAVQLSPTKHRQERAHLVCCCQGTLPRTLGLTPSLQRRCKRCMTWNPHCYRPHVVSHSADCRWLTVEQATISSNVGLSDSSCCLVLSKLDYGSATLAGLQSCQLP